MKGFRGKKLKEIKYFESREATIRHYLFGLLVEWIVTNDTNKKEIQRFLVKDTHIISKRAFKKFINIPVIKNCKFIMFMYFRNNINYNVFNKGVSNIEIIPETELQQKEAMKRLKEYITSHDQYIAANRYLLNTKKKEIYYRMLNFL